MAACGQASASPALASTSLNSREVTQATGLSATKLAMLTAEAETVTAGTPKNDGTITAIGVVLIGTVIVSNLFRMNTDG